MMKRAFDIAASALGLVVLSPFFLLAGFLIKIDSPGPVFFRQERIGKGFRPFLIYKFRTMVHDASRHGAPITAGNDPRITRVGRRLRQMKLDEFPQLINVLLGEMSLVGPRPEVRRYVELYQQDYQELLSVRPGITDLASLKYRHEAEILAQAGNSEEAYLKHILPEKINLAKDYLRQSSFLVDLTLIMKTLLRLLK